MPNYLKDGNNDHTGGSGSYNRDGSIHYTNFNRDTNSRTSYDEYRDGSVRNIHSTDQNNNKHTQHEINKDGDPRRY